MCSFLQKFETFQLFRRTNFRFELILILASEKRLSYSDNDWSRLRTRNEFSLSRRGEGPLVRNRHQEGGKHWRFNKTSLVGNRRSGTGFSIRHPARIVRVIDDGRYQCFQRAAKSEKKSREWSSLLHELRDNPDKFESRRSKRAFGSKQTIYLSSREDQEDRDEKGRDAVIPPRSREKDRESGERREEGWEKVASNLGRCCPQVARLQTKWRRVLELWLFPREPVTRLCNKQDRYEAIVDRRRRNMLSTRRDNVFVRISVNSLFFPLPLHRSFSPLPVFQNTFDKIAR